MRSLAVVLPFVLCLTDVQAVRTVSEVLDDQNTSFWGEAWGPACKRLKEELQKAKAAQGTTDAEELRSQAETALTECQKEAKENWGDVDVEISWESWKRGIPPGKRCKGRFTGSFCLPGYKCMFRELNIRTESIPHFCPAGYVDGDYRFCKRLYGGELDCDTRTVPCYCKREDAKAGPYHPEDPAE